MLLVILILAVCALVHAQEADLIREIQSELAYQENGGVFDFGEHLEEKGKRELEVLADEFQKDGLRLWIVTLPREYSANNAERLYSNLSFTERDVLIVFNSQQAYGKALALKGEKDLFVKYLAESRRYFNQYWAKGLAHYAELIRGRIAEKREKERFRRNLMLLLVSGISVAVVLTVAIIVLTARRRAHKVYQEKLSQMGMLFGELGERIGDLDAEKYTDEFLKLSERREKLEASKKDMIELDSLIRDMESLLSELEADNDAQSQTTR